MTREPWPGRGTNAAGITYPYKRNPYDRLFLVVHFVCAVLAFGAVRASTLSNCLAATAAIQDCRDRGTRRAGTGMGCRDAAGPFAERAVQAGLNFCRKHSPCGSGTLVPAKKRKGSQNKGA